MFEQFLAAQDRVYPRVLAELRAGDKQTHWMWFIFPQLTGLGRSQTAIRYGIADLDAARAYLAHPMLGARLRECTAIVGGVTGRTARDIFGAPDDLKFRSAMTLFSRAAPGPEGEVFRDALARYYGGEEDALTLGLIGLG